MLDCSPCGLNLLRSPWKLPGHLPRSIRSYLAVTSRDEHGEITGDPHLDSDHPRRILPAVFLDRSGSRRLAGTR